MKKHVLFFILLVANQYQQTLSMQTLVRGLHKTNSTQPPRISVGLSRMMAYTSLARSSIIKPQSLAGTHITTWHQSSANDQSKTVRKTEGHVADQKFLLDMRALDFLHKIVKVPTHYNRFYGSSFIVPQADHTIEYAIHNEALFMGLCVQASQARFLDQNPLHALIRRITKLQQARQHTIEYLNKDKTHMRISSNYDNKKQLTEKEVTEGLLRYIPWNNILQQTGDPKNPTFTASIWLNGQATTLICEPQTKPIEIAEYQAQVGTREITTHTFDFMQPIDKTLLAKFNKLLKDVSIKIVSVFIKKGNTHDKKPNHRNCNHVYTHFFNS